MRRCWRPCELTAARVSAAVSDGLLTIATKVVGHDGCCSIGWGSVGQLDVGPCATITDMNTSRFVSDGSNVL